MKKLIALMLAFGVTAGIAHAETQVLSQNAVGYVKVEALEGNLYLLRNDFESIDGLPMSIENVIDEQVPVGTVITLYDESTQQYKPGISRTFFGWGGAGTNVLGRGQSFFLRMPDAAGDADIFFMGEVPDSDTLSEFVPGLNMAGFPFPASRELEETEFADAAPVGTVITRWDAENQVWLAGVSKTFFGWGSNPTLNPGEGFFVTVPSTEPAFFVDEVKPYTWP